MAVFSGSVGDGDLADQTIPLLGISLDHAVAFRQANAGANVAVLAGMSYAVNTTTLASLDREMKCDGVTMDSLGVVPWNNLAGGGWLEVFGVIGAAFNPKRARITGAVEGADISPRVIRGASLAFTGVESFGTVTTAYGTGTAMAVAGNAVAASMIAAFFATRSGLKNLNKTQRYLQNTSTSLGISEARGTGSSFDFTAERALAGPWSAASVVLNPASNVASVKPLVVPPFLVAQAGLQPRPSGPRRVIFTVEPED